MLSNERLLQRQAPKGLPVGSPFEFDGVGKLGWSLFSTDFHLPLAVLLESAVRHNSSTMATYCNRRGVSLAPHGKTTMAPELFYIQLEDGAWAITAATVWQARIVKAAGIQRVLIANEVVTAAEIRWLADALSDGSGFEVYCWVDSIGGVRLMEKVLEARPPRASFNRRETAGGRAIQCRIS